MIDTATADAIAHRVNCYGIGAWLIALLRSLGAALPSGLAVVRARVPLELPQHGLRFTLYAREGAGQPDWADGLVLERAEFRAGRASLPFGLDVQAETFASAGARLSTDTAGGSARASYFLPDGRVVELTFKPGGAGLASVLVARLGSEMRWP